MARAEAHKLPSGSWRCKANYTDDLGKYRQKSFTAKTKREAEMKADAFLVNIKDHKEPSNRTLGMLIDEYIEVRSNILSPSTICGYDKIRRTAFPSIIDVPISKLTEKAYQAAIDYYTEKHNPKTVFNAHALAKRVLQKAGLHIADDVSLPQKIKKEKEIPDEADLRAFLSNIKDTRVFFPCLLASFLGLRHSEIIALQWGDIDVDKKLVSITKARVKDKYGVYVLKTTKTVESTRTLSMPQIIVDNLPERAEANDDDFIIQGSIKALDGLYVKLANRYGFNYSFHSLRHFYASYMLSIGMPNKYAQKRMGHATMDMLQEVYQHTFKNLNQEYDTILDKAFSSFFEPETKKEDSKPN